MKRTQQKSKPGTSALATAFLLAATLMLATSSTRAGTWTPLTDNAPGGVQLMLLLTDGTVACYDGDADPVTGGDWYRLTPDSSGSYINGSWAAIPMASMNDPRRYCSSQV